MTWDGGEHAQRLSLPPAARRFSAVPTEGPYLTRCRRMTRSALRTSGAPADERDQYPPPLPDAAKELAAGVAPVTVISYHSPPERLSALPLA
jgi:hypothetical protein